MDMGILYNLHKKYAPSEEIFDLVWSHSLIVEKIVKQIIESHPELDINANLAQAGALVHDIGVYVAEPYIKHGLIGAEIVRNEGLGEQLARIVERHIGTGISKEQIQERELPLPLRNFVPETLEEKLVGYADNFHSKKPKFNSYEEIKKDLSPFGEENVKRLEE